MRRLRRRRPPRWYRTYRRQHARSPGEKWGRWCCQEPGEVGCGIHRVIVCLQDAPTRRDHMWREVVNEEDVAYAEKVVPKEQIKIWAWENMNYLSHIFKEGNTGVLVGALIDRQVDVSEGRPSGLRGHTEHGSNIPWEIVAVGRATKRCEWREEWQ